MEPEKEIKFWRKMFYELRDDNEKWKTWNTVISLVAMMSLFLNAYLLFR